MKKKMFFKMGVVLLLSLAVLVGLAGCGAKPSAPTDEGENTIQEDTNTGNPVEDAAATNNLPEQGPDEINVDNGHDLTPQVDGPPYVYEVGGVNFECDINIYDYIYEENGEQWVDLKQMAEDVGWSADERQGTREWKPNMTYTVSSEQSLYIQLGGTTDDVRNGGYNYTNVLLFSLRDANNRAVRNPSGFINAVMKQSTSGSDYCIVGSENKRYKTSLDEIEIIAYMLDVGRQEADSFNLKDILGGSNLSGDNVRFYLP